MWSLSLISASRINDLLPPLEVRAVHLHGQCLTLVHFFQCLFIDPAELKHLKERQTNSVYIKKKKAGKSSFPTIPVPPYLWVSPWKRSSTFNQSLLIRIVLSLAFNLK